MRILFLTHAFNSLAQRLWCELTARGHDVSVELDIHDSVTEEAVALFRPHLVVAPYLRRAIPRSVWSKHCCLVVHPGIAGDRGPSSLDWAIHDGEAEWGVTVLQAEAELDAGPIWATAAFPMRRARKASLYRNEVTEAATRAVLEAVGRFEAGERPRSGPGRWRPAMRQSDRAIDWRTDTTDLVLRKLDAADGWPGVADVLFGERCHLFDGSREERLRGAPGELLARRETAVCRATVDGAVWIGHVKRPGGFKLPTTIALPEAAARLPEAPLDGWWAADHATWQDIRYEESGDVGALHFDFTNGAMGTRQCERLRAAFAWARTRPTRVLVLMGGEDAWSNGLHLNLIEAAESPADESWRNIHAIDDLAEAILGCDDRLVIAALQGSAGAGGAFLARAAHLCWVRDGVVLNPHYRNMGNLYGSEFWTLLLPARVGEEGARRIMERRLPMLAAESVAIGLYDACLPGNAAGFREEVLRRAAALVAIPARHPPERPLATYRADELAHMHRSFYGFDPSYHVARWHFVHKSPRSWTPRHLARHREG